MASEEEVGGDVRIEGKPMMGVREYKQSFFRPDALLSKVEQKEKRALSKMGAFIRTRMKSSIRYRKKASTPGSPPSAHKTSGFTRERKSKDGTITRQEKSPLKELIFFGYDSSTKTVVVGPAKFSRGEAPGVLEKGGTAHILTPVPRATPKRRAGPAQAETFKRLVKEGRIIVPPRQYTSRAITVKKRPFVAPAAKAEVSKFKQLLRMF